MKKTFYIVLLVVLVVSLAFTACEPEEGEEEGEQSPEVERVDIEMRALELKGVEPVDSFFDVYFTLDESALEDLLGPGWASEGGAYLNLRMNADGVDDGEEWPIQNLYFLSPYDRVDPILESPSAQFPGAHAIPVRLVAQSEILEIEAAAFVSPEPLEEPPEVEEFVTYTVDIVPYLVGGRLGGGSANSTIPWSIEPWIGPTSPPIRTATIAIPVANITTIDEGNMGCSPGAAARSVSYLGDVHGLDTEDPQDIYDGLVELMQTDICGNGTDDGKMLEGKNSYCVNKTLNIDSQLVYTDKWDPIGGSSWDDLVEQVQDALDAGCAIEVLIGFQGGGGQVAMVTCVTSHADSSATISYVDDPCQADEVAENREHVIATDQYGYFNAGWVDGFMIECVAD